ncbi:MAG TPA: hydroxyectoine utilization dehydratase EutB [Trueperaceae bacterium]
MSQEACPQPTLQDIYAARQRIRPLVRPTPLLGCEVLSRVASTEVYLKPENLQATGSFKVRGAANRLLTLTEEERARGVVTVSTGNHGRAVAYVAARLGMPATVCVSQQVPANKLAAIRQLGAELLVGGRSQDEAEAQARVLSRERRLTLIPPFDDPAVIAGQGTIGLELLDELPEVESVLVPLSGGGLIAGIALALKAANPLIRVVGLTMQRAPAMQRSLAAGHPVELPEEPTLADSLQGGVGRDNRYTFQLVRTYVDEVVLLSEDEIAAGMAFAFREAGLVLEGAGAVGIAGLLKGRVGGLGQRVAVVLSGRNVAPSAFLEVLERQDEVP